MRASQHLVNRLMLGASVVLVPLLLLHAYTLFDQRETAKIRASEQVRESAEAAAVDLTSVMGEAELALSRLAGAAPAAGMSADACKALLGTASLRWRADTIALSLSLFSPDGKELCSSGAGSFIRPASVPESLWFQRALRSEGPLLGGPVANLVGREPVLLMTLPLRDAEGRLEGIAAASIENGRLDAVLERVQLPEQGVLALINDQAGVGEASPDRVLAQSKEPLGPNKPPGLTSRASVVLARAAEAGGAAVVNDAAGDTWVVASSPLPHHRLRVVAAVPADVAFVAANAAMARAFGAALAAVLLGAALCYLLLRGLWRPIGKFAQVFKAQEAGDKQARFDEASVGVAGPLATALNKMLDSFKEDEARYVSQLAEASRTARLHQALGRTDWSELASLDSPVQLHERFLKVAVETWGASMGWVGAVDSTMHLVPTAWAGRARQYTDSFESGGEPAAKVPGGPSKMALLSGQPSVANDYMNDPLTTLWRQRASPFGIRASIAVPFSRGGAVAGTLNLYSAEIGFFDETKVQALQALAQRLTFALDKLDRHAAQQRALAESATRLAQLSAAVDATPDAVLTVDHNRRIQVFNEAAMKLFGTAAQDAMGHSLDRFIPELFWEIEAGAHDDTAHVLGGREVMGLRSDGTEFPLRATVYTVNAARARMQIVIARPTEAEH